jgi:hypothetical protein
MSKIALITSDRELYEKVGALCRDMELQNEIDLYFIRLDKAPDLTRKLQHEDVDVIVARGGLVMLIQPFSVKVPIVEIVTTGQDLARIFLKAKVLTGIERPRAAFIAFDNMATDVGVIAQLANVDLTIHRLQANEDIPPVVDEVARFGYDVVFGGTRTVRIASSLSVLSQQPQGNCALKAEIGCFLPENARFPPILATADAMRPCASNSTRGKPASILP